MIAIDTNIIVRLLTHDDEKQFQVVRKVFRNNDIFISDTVLLETEWVLRYAYEFQSESIINAFEKLLGLPNVHVDNTERLFSSSSVAQIGSRFCRCAPSCRKPTMSFIFNI